MESLEFAFKTVLAALGYAMRFIISNHIKSYFTGKLANIDGYL